MAERMKARRHLRRVGPPACPPKPAAEPKAAARPDPGAAAKPKFRSAEEYFLHEWCAARGPLFASPRVVVCRAIAIAEVLRICRASTDIDVAARASRVFDEAMREVPPSNNPAGGEAFAAASAALADVSRMGRTLSWEDDLHGALADYFAAHRGAGDEGFDHLRGYAWGRLLAAIFLSRNEALRLRAARTLLAWTRDDARKVGRERPAAFPPEVLELLKEIRDEVVAFRRARDTGGEAGAFPHVRPAGPPSRDPSQGSG
jgi:hypothetical protein